MSLKPAGPLPDAVYWRRRAVVVLAFVVLLLALVLILTWAFSGGSEGEETDVLTTGPTPALARPTPSAAPTRTDGPTPSAAPTRTVGPPATDVPVSAGPTSTAGLPACDPAELTVAPEADANSYALAGSARLTLALTSTATARCRRPQGVVLTVTSGPDRIWSSEDCAPLEIEEPAPEAVPGRTVLLEVLWDLTRSVPGCSEGLPALRPGTYVVSGRVGELRAQGDAFTLGGG